MSGIGQYQERIFLGAESDIQPHCPMRQKESFWRWPIARSLC